MTIVDVAGSKKKKKAKAKAAAAAPAAAADASDPHAPAGSSSGNGSPGGSFQQIVRVAIVGGGLSGAATAWGLSRKAPAGVVYECHIFDTGRRHLGGRCSSRVVRDQEGREALVDHACQMFAIAEGYAPGADGLLPELLEELVAEGVVRPIHPGKDISDVCIGGAAEENPPGSTLAERCYVSGANGRQGWCGVAEHIAKAAEEGAAKVVVHRGAWVQRVQQVQGADEGARGGRGTPPAPRGRGRGASVEVTPSAPRLQWTVSMDSGKGGGRRSAPTLPAFHHVVFAHSGKCATQLINTANVDTVLHGPLMCRFLRYDGGAAVPPSRAKLDICSLYVLVVRVSAPAGDHPDNAVRVFLNELERRMFVGVRGSAVLKMIGNNTRKYGEACQGGGGMMLTLISSAQFAGKHKGPQEHLPPTLRDTVTTALLAEARRVAGAMAGGDAVPAAALSFVPLHLQLWGAALPANVYHPASAPRGRHAPGSGDHSLYDPRHAIGVVGDWLSAGSVEGALLSGLDMAAVMARSEAYGTGVPRAPAQGAFVPLPPSDATAEGTPAVVAGLARPAEEVAAAAVGGGRGGGRGRGAGAVPAGGRGRGFAAAVPSADSNGKIAGNEEGAWKWPIRMRIWDYMEKHDIARFPRPVHHRIPNFVGAEKAAGVHFAALPEFQAAKVVKVNPDTPQKAVRSITLRQKKTLLVPQPRLLRGFFSKLHPNAWPPNRTSSNGAFLKTCDFAATTAGARELGLPLNDFRDMRKYPADMVVLGSVAVNPHNGARIGKGEGFAEIEYAVLRMMGCITEDTPVVTTVHDCQLVGEDVIPTSKLLLHDLCVDIIVTPTQVIRVPKENKPPKPEGVYWHLLSPQKLAQVKLLGDLKRFLEAEGGGKLALGKDEVLPPTAKRRNDE